MAEQNGRGTSASLDTGQNYCTAMADSASSGDLPLNTVCGAVTKGEVWALRWTWGAHGTRRARLHRAWRQNTATCADGQRQGCADCLVLGNRAKGRGSGMGFVCPQSQRMAAESCLQLSCTFCHLEEITSLCHVSVNLFNFVYLKVQLNI